MDSVFYRKWGIIGDIYILMCVTPHNVWRYNPLLCFRIPTTTFTSSKGPLPLVLNRPNSIGPAANLSTPPPMTTHYHRRHLSCRRRHLWHLPPPQQHRELGRERTAGLRIADNPIPGRLGKYFFTIIIWHFIKVILLEQFTAPSECRSFHFFHQLLLIPTLFSFPHPKRRFPIPYAKQCIPQHQ